MIGLGKMGANMTTRLIKGGHRVVVYDRNPDAVKLSTEGGAVAATSVEHLAEQLGEPRAVWIMVPVCDATEQTIEQLTGLLSPNDTILDGGNSNYKDSQCRAAMLREHQIYLTYGNMCNDRSSFPAGS